MPVEEGFVPTPELVADWLAAEVLLDSPTSDARILYPGAGTGRIAAAVHRRCSVRDLPAPDGVAVERNRARAQMFHERLVAADAAHNHGRPPMSKWSRRFQESYRNHDQERSVSADIEVMATDFLRNPPDGPFNYIVANPPYLAYKDIPDADRDAYREPFDVAQGQFDLYMPFVEQMLDLLAPDGLLAFLAPVRYLTLPLVQPLRQLLRQYRVATPMLVPELAFPDHQITTAITLVGGRNAAFLHENQPPSEERLGLTNIYGNPFHYIVRGLGVDDEATSEVFREYVDRKRFHQRRIRHTDEDDREELNPHATGSTRVKQTGLGEWTEA
jgi:SAM-dependent methyltransferase